MAVGRGCHLRTAGSDNIDVSYQYYVMPRLREAGSLANGWRTAPAGIVSKRMSAGQRSSRAKCRTSHKPRKSSREVISRNKNFEAWYLATEDGGAQYRYLDASLLRTACKKQRDLDLTSISGIALLSFFDNRGHCRCEHEGIHLRQHTCEFFVAHLKCFPFANIQWL